MRFDDAPTRPIGPEELSRLVGDERPTARVAIQHGVAPCALDPTDVVPQQPTLAGRPRRAPARVAGAALAVMAIALPLLLLGRPWLPERADPEPARPGEQAALVTRADAHRAGAAPPDATGASARRLADVATPSTMAAPATLPEPVTDSASPARAGSPSPPPRVSESEAAALLAQGRHVEALAAYRVLESLQPDAPVYGLIRRVLQRRVEAECDPATCPQAAP